MGSSGVGGGSGLGVTGLGVGEGFFVGAWVIEILESSIYTVLLSAIFSRRHGREIAQGVDIPSAFHACLGLHK